MSNCRGCGSHLELTPEQLSQAVDEVLEETRPDIKPFPGTCPLCGHSTAVPLSQRKSVQFALLLAVLAVASVLLVFYSMLHRTERQQAVEDSVRQAEAHEEVVRYLGSPLKTHGDVRGQVKTDETGWQEARLVIPVRGSKLDGVLTVVAGRTSGVWQFTTLDLLIPGERKRIDLVSGRIVTADSESYAEVHTQAALTPQFVDPVIPLPRWNGDFPCVSAPAVVGSSPTIGNCGPALPITAFNGGTVDRFDVDLRFGKFNLRQMDLLLTDGQISVPLTRTYTSQFWVHPSRVNAFGRNSTHDFDIAPVGSRKPYTYQLLVLADGDFVHFPRVSRGGGYADAVYRHSETGTRFYKALTSWTGTGWETRLADGSIVRFPESYNAHNMAQGAPTEIVDAGGSTLSLIRDRQRNLREIRTPRGRAIILRHDGEGRVVRAEADGEWVDYRYNGAGALVETRHWDGRARHYTYADELLTAVHDEVGRPLIQNWYLGSWLMRQQYSNGTSCEFRYRMAANRRYAEQATVAFGDGATQTVRTDHSVSQFIKEMQ